MGRCHTKSLVQHSWGLWSHLEINQCESWTCERFPPEEGDRAQLENPDACAGALLCLHALKMVPGPGIDSGLF